MFAGGLQMENYYLQNHHGHHQLHHNLHYSTTTATSNTSTTTPTLPPPSPLLPYRCCCIFMAIIFIFMANLFAYLKPTLNKWNPMDSDFFLGALLNTFDCLLKCYIRVLLFPHHLVYFTNWTTHWAYYLAVSQFRFCILWSVCLRFWRAL